MSELIIRVCLGQNLTDKKSTTGKLCQRLNLLDNKYQPQRTRRVNVVRGVKQRSIEEDC